MHFYDSEMVCKNCGMTYGDHRACDDACLDFNKIDHYLEDIFGTELICYKEKGTMFKKKRERKAKNV